MSAPAVRPLRDVLRPRNDIVHPRDNPTGTGTFVGLEHIEPQTGRRIGDAPLNLGTMTGRKARFLPGDIVYGYLRPYLNKVWIAEFDGFCSVDQYVFVVDPEVGDVEYVAWYLRSPAYLAAAPIDETPGQLPRIRLDEVLSTPIPLPPLDEQRRIAARLREQLATDGKLAEAIGARARLLSHLRSQVMAAAYCGLASSGSALGSLGTLTDGDWILTADYSPSGVRLLQVGDVGRGHLTIKSRRYISWERAQELQCTVLQCGDILISRMPEPLGRACTVPDLGYPAITAVDVSILRVDEKRVDRDFLVGYMNSPEWFSAVDAQASGATRQRISRRNLEALPVPVPPLEEQRRIAARLREQLDEIDRARAALEAQRAAAAALPAAILREAFDPTVA